MMGLLLLPANNALALSYDVNLNTSSLSGTSAQLAFDFIDGGPPSNTTTISAFSTNGTLGSSSTTGGVSGTLPGNVTLTDSSFFNEYLQNITLATNLSFHLDATNTPPGLGSIPDSFSFFLLAQNTSLPLFTTSDPTGSDALFALDLNGTTQGTLAVFSVPNHEVTFSVTSPVTAVPEPSTWLLLGSGVLVLAFVKRKVIAQ
jgi:hypothetical protein